MIENFPIETFERKNLFLFFFFINCCRRLETLAHTHSSVPSTFSFCFLFLVSSSLPHSARLHRRSLFLLPHFEIFLFFFYIHFTYFFLLRDSLNSRIFFQKKKKIKNKPSRNSSGEEEKKNNKNSLQKLVKKTQNTQPKMILESSFSRHSHTHTEI